MSDGCLKRSSRLLALALFFLAASGCASGRLELARQSFYDGRLDHAARVLEDPKKIAGRDRLLFFMENGVIEHHRQNYAESIRLLRRAAERIEALSVISASRQGASLLTSERITRYRGEYAERLWVHTYLMMNYLLTARPEEALVEARQALEVYAAHPDALRSAHFTRALVAHCFEVNGEINSAFIEYRKLAEKLPDPAAVADKLVVLARQLGFSDEAARYGRLLSKRDLREIAKNPGGRRELIFFVHQGRAPDKIPRNLILPPAVRFSFVAYRHAASDCRPPSVYGAEAARLCRRIDTDLALVLTQSLKERADRMLAKETARVAAKEAIASNIEDDFLEFLVRGVFFVTEEPDTRCWQTLPACWSLLRIPLGGGRRRTPPIAVENRGVRYTVEPFQPVRRCSYFVVRQQGSPEALQGRKK
jgi:hypothetical protein